MNLERIDEMFGIRMERNEWLFLPRLAGCSRDFFNNGVVIVSFTDGLNVVFDGESNAHGTKYLLFFT